MLRKLLLVALLYAILVGNSVAMVQIASCETNEKIIFKILAIEGQYNTEKKIPFEEGQNLIISLLGYTNWNNSTIYESNIRLLSFDSEICEECKCFFVGEPTKENLKREISEFKASSNDYTVAFLYFSCHNCEDILCLDTNNPVRASVLNSWLGNYSAVVVLDCCSSEWYINELSNQTVLASSKKYQSSYGNPGVFTLALIDSFSKAADDNEDGWISLKETFEFAKNATEQYAFQNNFTQNPVMHLSYDLPWVRRTQVTRKADINNDGIVNILDFSIIVRAFGSKPWDSNWNEKVDLDCSKMVNFNDLLLAVVQFGKKT